ncbi:MAG: restriction endonuclease subunit S [Oscillospiraceae bacterium]|nr:restriction endonuclease subunit S [Oscillospiraceae bacterium]
MKCKLSDVMEIIGGGTPKTSKPEYWNGNIPWISVKDFNGERRYVGKTEKRITEKGLNNSSTKLLNKDDIIISARGTVGELAIIPSPMAFNQSCYGLRAIENIYPMFLYYLLLENVNVLKHNTHGSVFDTITRETFENIEIDIPDLATQQKIASVLSVLDDKIELNNRINKNLEEQAQAIFKSWFVDFEPFGGVMPEDWSEITLGAIATISTKSVNPTKNPDLYLEHYSIPAFDEQHYPVFEYAKEIKSNKYILTTNSVMISKLNPDTKRIWRPLCLSENPVCSTEFIVYEAIKPKHKDYLYSLIDSQAFSDYLCTHTTGSTNSRQRATPKTTLDFPCLLPTEEIIARFCGIVTPMYEQIAAGIVGNQRLAALRDTLLPKLMNGEIDVSEVKI